MSSTTFTANALFFVEDCCNCGMQFAMTKDYRDARLKDRKTFHCPAGHPQHYTGKSEEQKLREEVERQQQMLDAAQQREHRARNERDQISKAHRKMRMRVMNGVCPCCNRTFQNLMQHMRSEHPDFAKKPLLAIRTSFGMTQAQVAEEAGVQPVHVSLYEHEKPVAEYAKRALDSWVERQEAK